MTRRHITMIDNTLVILPNIRGVNRQDEITQKQTTKLRHYTFENTDQFKHTKDNTNQEKNKTTIKRTDDDTDNKNTRYCHDL